MACDLVTVLLLVTAAAAGLFLAATALPRACGFTAAAGRFNVQDAAVVFSAAAGLRIFLPCANAAAAGLRILSPRVLASPVGKASTDGNGRS